MTLEARSKIDHLEDRCGKAMNVPEENERGMKRW